jgi:hypothetical protein
MSQENENGIKAFVAGEALAINRRVKLSGTTVVYSDAGEVWIGTTKEAVASGANVSVKLLTFPGTRKVVAAGTFSAGAELYGAVDGKIDDIEIGQVAGTALEAATAAGAVIEMLPHVGIQHVNYDRIFGELLSGGTEQDIDAASDTQNYPLGTKRETPDGEEYFYGKAGGTINTDMACWAQNPQHIAYTTIAASALISATSIKIDVGASDGVAANGAIAANELVGGRIVVFPPSDNTFVRTITGNTVVAADGGEMTLTLNKPIPVAITVDVHHCEVMASPYLDVRTGNSGGIKPFLGAGTVAATVGQFFWILKKGWTWLAPQAEVGVGDHDNEIVFRHDGSVDEHDYSDAYNTKAQHAGFVLTRAAAGTQGAPFIALGE